MKDKLLIVDDEALILKSLEHLFEDDYEVLTASDAEMALVLAAEHDVAVILCDERMPKVSGHEFLRRVRDVSNATRVMVSGYADLNALTDAINQGQIFAYVSKPWEPLALKSLVRAAKEQFRLMEEIHHERELLRALMESIPDPIYFKDCQSRFTKVNHAQALALGVTEPAECIGKSDSDYFDSFDALRWRLQEEEIMRTGKPELEQIERRQKPNDKARWTSTTKAPMFDRSGQVSGITGIARDITALKDSEETLRGQNEHNRMILETASDAFISMDPDGCITAWNPQAQSTFGWTAAEVMGKSWSNTVIAPAYRELHAEGVEQFLMAAHEQTGRGSIELVAVHRDGHEFPVEATVWMIQTGGAPSFNAFLRDISERRRAEQARRKSAELIHLLQSVTVAANRSSSLEDAAQFCLDRICAHTGWPLGHLYLLPDNSSELISSRLWHLEQNGRMEAFLQVSDVCRFTPGAGLPGRVLESGKPEWIVDLADKDLFPARVHEAAQAGIRSAFAVPLFAEKVVGVLEFFSVYTAQPDLELLAVMEQIGSQLGHVIRRQRAEEGLQRATASAESANRAKSEFLSTVSHEMRTPMNAILGVADLLSESSLLPVQREYVGIFQKTGAHLLSLINDILDLSKVESGHLEMESIRFDPRNLLEQIVDMMAPKARNAGLQLTLEVLPGVPEGLMGDPNRLRQILINLVGNALKFTEKGGVTLRVEPEHPEGWLRFSVLDTGIGIAADKVEMIFERFTQVDSSSTRRYGGTGLGLAISKGLVELMGGQIGCSSEPGKGSTFFLAAPFGICKEMETSTNVQPTAISMPLKDVGKPQSGTSILIVEDCKENVWLMEAYLNDSGFELNVAENGEIAVEKVIRENPSLVLMDVQMPVMDGLEATRRIRQWEASTNAGPVPILALTAHAAEGRGRSSLEAGCDEHLTKPITKAALLEAISRYVRVGYPLPN